MYELRMKRIYEDIAPDDGQRVLVDRLWPRGVKKTRRHSPPGRRKSRRPRSCGSSTTRENSPSRASRPPTSTSSRPARRPTPSRRNAAAGSRRTTSRCSTPRRTRSRTTSTSCAAGCCTRWACARSEATSRWRAAGIGCIAGPALGEPHSETSLFVAWRNCAGMGMSSCQMMRTGREPL